MARDGNGDYTAPSNTVNPATTGTTIDPTDFNEFVDDLETALSASNFTAATSGTDNSVMRADGTGGRKVQTSAMIVDDSGNASGIANLTITGNLSGATLTDLAVGLGSDAQGDIYYRDASGNLARLGPGTAGQTLVSGGAGANPSWSAAGSGDVSAASTFGTDNVLVRSDGTSKGVQATGITVADSTNDVSGVGSITPVAGSAIRTATSDTNTLLLQAYDVDGAAYTTFATLTAGNTPTFNLSSSVTVGGVAIASTSGAQTLTNKTVDSADNSITLDMSEMTFAGTKANFDSACTDDNFIFDSEIGSVVQGYNASLAAIASITFNQGEILYHNGTSLVALGVGTSGQVLQSGGTGANPSWTTVSGTGDVTAASTISDNAIVRGDGGAKGVQQSALSIDDSGNLSGVVNQTMTGYLDGATNHAGLGNLIINGGFSVWQRGTSFTSVAALTNAPTNADDTYLADRWLLLSDGNDIFDVIQTTAVVPTGSYSAIRLDVETANKRGGVCQIIENKNAAAIIGGVASLQFKASVGGSNATVDSLRYIVASWTSTADVVTSDIVSAWSTEGNNPTLATNWTIEASGTVSLTSSFQTFTAENIAIDTASTKNVAVFLMIENGDGTVGDLVYITDVKLEEGPVATAYVPRDIGIEVSMCQRYLIVPGNDGTVAYANLSYGDALNASNAAFYFRLPVLMRVDPSATEVGSLSLFQGATGKTNGGIVANNMSKSGGRVQYSSASLTTGNNMTLTINNTSAGYIYFDAEL